MVYSVEEESLHSWELGSYITYGIRSETGNVVADVSTDRVRLEEFVRELNASELAETHLADVIEDLFL